MFRSWDKSKNPCHWQRLAEMAQTDTWKDMLGTVHVQSVSAYARVRVLSMQEAVAVGWLYREFVIDFWHQYP